MLISLKFIISDRLPKISYLTLLDIYLHSSYIVMMALLVYVCANAAFFSSMGYSDSNVYSSRSWSMQVYGMNVRIHEPVLLSVFCLFWVFIHVGLGWMYFLRSEWYRKLALGE